VARLHAEAWADLTRRGRVVPAHDLWIAATALAHGFAVATFDPDDFRRVPGLRVLSPEQ
jgi:tRNA(fMet)-specific endonuclease VapC